MSTRIKLLFIKPEDGPDGRSRMIVYLLQTAWVFAVAADGALALLAEHSIPLNDPAASALRGRTPWDVYREHPELRAFLESRFPACNLFATVPPGEVWARELTNSEPLEARKVLESAIVMEVRANWRAYAPGERLLRDEAERCHRLKAGEFVAIVWRESWRQPGTNAEMTAWYGSSICNIDGHLTRSQPKPIEAP